MRLCGNIEFKKLWDGEKVMINKFVMVGMRLNSLVVIKREW